MKKLSLFLALLALFLGPIPLPASDQASTKINLIDGSVFVKRALVNVSASTTGGTIVTAVPGKFIRVLSMVMVSGGTATSVTILGNTTALTPAFLMGVNGVMVLPMNEHGWFETAMSEGLKVTTGSGSTTGILVTYIETIN